MKLRTAIIRCHVTCDIGHETHVPWDKLRAAIIKSHEICNMSHVTCVMLCVASVNQINKKK